MESKHSKDDINKKGLLLSSGVYIEQYALGKVIKTIYWMSLLDALLFHTNMA